MNKDMDPDTSIDSNEEIDFQSVIKTLLREKFLILIIVFLSTTITTIFSSTTNRVWIGSFNIVVKDESKSQGFNNNSFLGQLSNLNINTNAEKQTQILILKSPLVLKPVYEFVMKYNQERNPDIYKNSIKPSFEKWLDSDLKIEFKKDSTVLDVKYQSTDKDLIIQALNLISSKYRSYSKSDKEKNINKTIEYLETQSVLMREKFFLSQKSFNEFSIANGLGDLDGFVALGNSGNPLLNNNSSDLDLSSIDKILANQKLNNISNGNLRTENKAGQRYKLLFARLEKYEADYVDLSSKLKPNSELLQNLKKRIDNLKSSLKRPNEILLEFKNLKDEASRNGKILQQIENNLELIRLQKIRTPNAWELISEAKIDDKPVYPNKKKILFLTLIVSSIIGSLIAILKEKISGKIFEINDFKKLINFKYLDNINNFDPEYNSKIIIKNLEIKNAKETVGILYITDNFFENEISEPIKFSKKFFKYKFLNYKNLKEIDMFDNVIIIVTPGKVTHKNLEAILNYLKIYFDEIAGWIFLKEDLEILKKIL